MRNILKAATLESKFPILSVEVRMHPFQGCGRDHRLQGLLAGAVHGHFRKL